jgi:hypothetical protein
MCVLGIRPMKKKVGEEKKMYNKYSQLINMNQYSICENFERLMEMVENNFYFQCLITLGHLYVGHFLG